MGLLQGYLIAFYLFGECKLQNQHSSFNSFLSYFSFEFYFSRRIVGLVVATQQQQPQPEQNELLKLKESENLEDVAIPLRLRRPLEDENYLIVEKESNRFPSLRLLKDSDDDFDRLSRSIEEEYDEKEEKEEEGPENFSKESSQLRSPRSMKGRSRRSTEEEEEDSDEKWEDGWWFVRGLDY